MTLILASVRPHDVVLTADGLRVTYANDTITGMDLRCQKLFPIPDHPVVIATIGENLLDGQPMKTFLGRFIERLNAGNFTVLEIADQLRNYAHAAIRARFNELINPRFGVGLWVVGFSYHEQTPCAVEVFWSLGKAVLSTEERTYPATWVIAGGCGQDQITPVNWHEIDGKTVEEVRGYHDALMQQAIDFDIDPNGVGGLVHELVITPSEWRWTQPPKAESDEIAPATQRSIGSKNAGGSGN